MDLFVFYVMDDLQLLLWTSEFSERIHVIERRCGA